MSQIKRNIIVGFVSVVVLVGLYFMLDRSKNTALVTDTKTSIGTASTTTVDLGNGVSAVVSEGSTVKVVKPLSVPQPIPSLTRQVSFNVTLDPKVKTFIEAKVPELQATLKKDPKIFEPWIFLGTYFKTAGDYEGAKLYWDYAGKLVPTDFISFGNLGNMYAYQLKDMVNAEKYYNQAIKNGPTQIYLYIQFAEALRDVSKNTTKAKAIIDQGLKANPNNEALVAFKATLN